MPNEFIVKNGLISQGNVTVSGSISTTSPLNLSGSLNIDGNINLTGSRTIQTVTGSATSTGPSLTVLAGNGGSSSGNGGILTLKGGNAVHTSGVGGDVYIQGGDKTGGGRAGYVYIGVIGGVYQTYLLGSPIFNWDGPNAANVVSFQRNGSNRFIIYDDVNLNANYFFNGGATTINAVWNNWNSVIVRGKGATSATTAFQVQNANASASLAILDNGFIGINTGSAQYNLDINGSLRASSVNVPTVGESTTSANITSTGTGTGFGFFSSTMHFTDGTNKIFGGGNAYSNLGFVVGANAFFGWRRSGNILNGIQNTQTRLYSDANDTIDQRNSANSQSFRIYNTYTDTSNYERNTQAWSGNIFNIVNEAAGTGIVRSVNIQNTLNISGSNVGIGTTSPSASLDIRGIQTATGSIARTMLISSSLNASANSDVLVGLDINPTFTNGAFTGVTNISARITGNITVSNRIIVGGTSFLTGQVNPAYSIQAQSAIQLMSAASTNKFNLIDTDPASFWQARVDTAYGLTTIMGVVLAAGSYNGTLGNAILTGMATEIGGALGVQSRIGVKSFIGLDGSTSRYIRFWEPGVAKRAVIGHTDSADGGHLVIKTGDATTLSDGVQAIRIFQTTQNVVIGTPTTDAGFKLDVNGTARVSGNTIIGPTTTRQGTASTLLLKTSDNTGATPSLGFFRPDGLTGVDLFYDGVANSLNFKYNSLGTLTTVVSIGQSGFSLPSGVLTLSNGLSFSSGNINLASEQKMFLRALPEWFIGYDSGLEENKISTRDDGTNRYITFGGTTTASVWTPVLSVKPNTKNVGIGIKTPADSAKLDITSTTQGFLPPRMTGAQAELISSPAEGLMVYATSGTGVTITSKGWWGFDGATWVKFN